MNILENRSLQRLNTLGLPAKARLYLEARSEDELRDAVAFAEERGVPVLILGGGSNVVLTRDFPGLVARIALKGIDLIEEKPDHVLIRAAAGEDWTSFVEHCLGNDYFGLENLSMIPGTVGAAPMQNIGAFGVELRDRLDSLEALDRPSGRLVRFSNRECGFSYRNSVFKQQHIDRHIITSVTMKLMRTPAPVTSYGSVREELEAMGVTEVTPHLVSEAVCRLRERRLPDPAVLGNAGSFFKNPTVSAETFETLKLRYEDLIAYPETDEGVKLAAGWMIDRMGWKGFRRGAVGVHTEHALVLVNYGGATADEVLGLAHEIQQSIREAFGVELEIEPRVY